MKATHTTDDDAQLPSYGVLFMERCPNCGVRCLVSGDGLTTVCANYEEGCDYQGLTEGLTRNTGPDKLREKRRQAKTHVVYYIRFANRIKIGTTSDLERRLLALPYDELLATEPGDRTVESRRHTQFRAARIVGNREWFWMTDDLMAHIEGLRRG